MVAKSLVTGGAGFIGSHLVDHLIDSRGDDVVVLDDLSGGFTDNVNRRARFVEGSVTDAGLVESLFARESFDYVYHLAAYAAEGLSSFIKRFNHTNNLMGSINLINASVNTGVKCFVFTSSIAVYGTNQVPMTEDLVPSPDDSYGIAKFAVEMELRASHGMFGLDYVVFRPHNVYGQRQNLGDMYRNVLGIFMNRIMQGEDLIIFGDGEQRRAFTCVDDIIPAIAGSVENDAAKNSVFNVGSDEHYSVNQLAGIVMSAMERTVGIRHVQARREAKVAYCDHARFKSVFVPSNHTPLAEGVEKMANWARGVGVRKAKRFDDIEIEKNLPSVWKNIE